MKAPTKAELREKIAALEKEVEALKKAQRDAESQQEQTWYKRLFNSASMGIFLTDAQNKIVDANLHALKILGYSYDEITSFTANDLIHPDNLNAQPLITAKDIADTDQAITLERHYRTKRGRYVPVEVHLRKFRDEMLLITFQDLSRRKASEKALREANEALEVVYQCTNAAIVSLDRDRRVMFWNPAAEKIFGWTQDEVVGKTYPAVPEETWDEYCEFFNQKMISGRSFTDLEVLRKRKDGSRFYVSVTSGPTHNESGEVSGLISVMIDITERKQAELALQQSEERYRSLVENTQDGFFICDILTGQFRFLNKSMCDLLNYTSEEALKLTLWDIISPEDHATLKTVISQDPKSINNSTTRAYQVHNHNSAPFRAEISIASVTYQEEPVIQGLLRDVTEKERLHAKLQQAQRLESIGTLAGGVAHDFNNLLMAIQGNTSLALAKISPSQPVYKKLKNITTYVQDASSLTKQLLGFARGGKYEVKTTDMNKLIEKTARMFGRTKKEITIQLNPQNDIWPVAVDRGQIEQVLLNLLVNGWQAMPDGGHIYIETANVVLDEAFAGAYNIAPGNYVKTSVTDTGVGMDKEIQDKIFEPFYTTKDRARGTGLGLASAYGIVKNHDGIITVYSEISEGTTFTFHLPITQSELSSADTAFQPIIPGSETILLVDDEAMVMEVAQEMLEELGYNTMTASSGQEALEIYLKNQHAIDLVVLDMIMPDMSGGDTYNQMRKINPDIKALLSSGYSIEGKASQIMRCGCNGFIQKPFNIEELSNKVREILDEY